MMYSPDTFKALFRVPMWFQLCPNEPLSYFVLTPWKSAVKAI
jgi:hypothetical protein